MTGPRIATLVAAATLAGFAFAGCGVAFAAALLVRHAGGGIGARVVATLAIACVVAAYWRVTDPVAARFRPSPELPDDASAPIARVVARAPAIGGALIAAVGAALIWRP